MPQSQLDLHIDRIQAQFLPHLPPSAPTDGGFLSRYVEDAGSDASLIITMSRPNREIELDGFDLWDSQEVEHTQERIIRARIAPGRGQSDVQVELGPWSVRIQGLRGINRKEAVKIARGLQLPAADTAGAATEAASAAALCD